MNKWKADTHAFQENQEEYFEGEIKQKDKYKRASFKERVARRASDIFKSHSKSKDQVHNKLEERRLEQRARLEEKLKARIAQQRKMELKGEKPTKSFKQAVHMLTKQILVFRTTAKQIAPSKHVNKTFVDEHIETMDDNESPYALLNKAIVKAHVYLKVNEKQSNQQLVAWIANLNKLLNVVLNRCIALHGSVPSHVTAYLKEEFLTIQWKWQTNSNISGTYTPPLRMVLLPWCLKMADHFDSHHQKKIALNNRDNATDILYSEGGIHYEKLELTAYESFQKANRDKMKAKKKADAAAKEAGIAPVEISTRQRPLFAMNKIDDGDGDKKKRQEEEEEEEGKKSGTVVKEEKLEQ